MNVALTSLWLPILLSSIAVFLASSIFWMVVQHHNADWKKLPDEEAARATLKGTEPGQYSVPHAADGKARASEEWQQKFKDGPAAMIVVFPHGSLAMGKQMSSWFIYCIVISTLVAYVAGATLLPGTEYLKVFQVTGVMHSAWTTKR